MGYFSDVLKGNFELSLGSRSGVRLSTRMPKAMPLRQTDARPLVFAGPRMQLK